MSLAERVPEEGDFKRCARLEGGDEVLVGVAGERAPVVPRDGEGGQRAGLPPYVGLRFGIGIRSHDQFNAWDPRAIPAPGS